jgi:hypothetical protein
MHLQLLLLLAITASAQLNELARKAGKLYFGTALDNVNIGADERYMRILNDTREFGQLTPANGQKVFTPPPFLSLFLSFFLRFEREIEANGKRGNSGLQSNPNKEFSTTAWANKYRISRRRIDRFLDVIIWFGIVNLLLGVPIPFPPFPLPSVKNKC